VIEIDVASPPPEYLTDPYGEEFTLTVGPFLTVVQHGNSYVLRAIAWSSAPTLRPVQRGLLEGHLNEGCALSSL